MTHGTVKRPQWSRHVKGTDGWGVFIPDGTVWAGSAAGAQVEVYRRDGAVSVVKLEENLGRGKMLDTSGSIWRATSLVDRKKHSPAAVTPPAPGPHTTPEQDRSEASLFSASAMQDEDVTWLPGQGNGVLPEPARQVGEVYRHRGQVVVVVATTTGAWRPAKVTGDEQRFPRGAHPHRIDLRPATPEEVAAFEAKTPP